MMGRRSRESQSAGRERDEGRKADRVMERERRKWTRESVMRERFLFQAPFLPEALLHLLPGL